MTPPPQTDEWGAILPPMPSEPIPPPTELYGKGRTLQLIGDEADAKVTPPLRLKVLRDYGTLSNDVTRQVLCRITDTPNGPDNDVMAIVYDPLYVPWTALPLLWPKELKEKREEYDSDVEVEYEETKSWEDYFPKPDPLVRVQGRPLQSRAAYAQDYFLKEVSCYRKLHKHQGEIIPKCLGTYTMDFPDREHAEDRTVHVLVLRHVNGLRMDKLKSPGNLSDMTTRLIREQILGIQTAFLNEGILWPTVRSRNFVLVEPSQKIIAHDFSTTYDLESVEEKHREEDIEAQKEIVLDWLDDAFPIKIE